MAKKPDDLDPKRKGADQEPHHIEKGAEREEIKEPNFSLDEPDEVDADMVAAELLMEEDAAVLEDEPVLAEPVSGASASGSSSVVEIAEVAEEPSHVLSAEVVQDAGTSSVVEIAEVVEDPSHVMSAEPVREGGASSVVEIAEVVEDPSHVLSAEPVQASGASSVIEVADVVEDPSHILSADVVQEAGGSSVVEIAELVEEPSHVLAHEPVVAAGGSSVIEISELVEDDSSHVLGEEVKGGSSVISASAIQVESDVVPSAVVEEISAVAGPAPASDVVMEVEEVEDDAVPIGEEPSDVTATPATPPPASGDDNAAFEFLPVHEDAEHEDKHRTVHGDDDAVDLGSAPEGYLAPSLLQKHSEKPEPVSAADDQATEDINWNDIGVDSKVVKQDDGEQTIGFAPDNISDNISEEETLLDAHAVADKDDVQFDDDDAGIPQKKGALASDVEEDLVEEDLVEEDLAADALLNDDEELGDDKLGATRKIAKGAHEDADELAASAFLDDDEAPAAKKVKGEADDAEVVSPLPADDELGDDEPPVTKKKKKKKVEEDEEGELVGAGAGKRGTPAPKPRYGRRWLGGMLLATLLLGGGAAGVWYAKPDLLEQAYKSSPNFVAPKKDKARVDPVHVLARAQMDNKNYAGALQILDAADKAPLNLSTRAEARWLKYLQAQNAAKKPLDKNADDVKKVLADLTEAGNDVLKLQVAAALEGSGSGAGAQTSAKNLLELKDMVEKEKSARELAEKQVAGIAETLVKEKLLEDKDKLDPAALQKIFKDLSETRTDLAAVNKLLEDAKIKDAGDKGVEKLLTAKKDAEEKLDLINKVLADEKVQGEGAKGLDELIRARNKLAKDRDELDEAVKGAYKDLAGGVLPPNEDPRAKMAEAVKSARSKSESPLVIPLLQLANSLGGLGTGAGKVLEKSFDMAALNAELAFYRLREPFVVTPDRKMDAYIALFQTPGRKDQADLTQASKEAAWVLSKEANSTPEARAKALYVNGLAARNLGNFEVARKDLAEALKAGTSFKNAPWLKLASTSFRELTDPAAYFLPRAERLAAQGNLQGAQDELNLGLQAFPNNARLLALRGLVRLQSAHGTKGVEAAQKDIRQDAEAASKDNSAAADAAYVLGLLDEELGNFDRAESAFRQAIKTHQGDPDTASRYVIALARLLQRDRLNSGLSAVPMIEEPAEPRKDDPEPKKADVKELDLEPKKKDQDEPKKADVKDLDIEPKKKDEVEPKKADVKDSDVEPKKKDEDEPKKDTEPKKDSARLDAIRNLLSYALVAVQLPGDADDEDPAAAARIQESIDLAKKLIESTNPKIKGQGYMILGQALSKRGRRTDGMREYVKGLELLFPGTQSKDMAKLLEEHPAFQQPDTAKTNPALAEQFFGKGLHMFWSRNYPEAETQFRQAIQFFNLDARYQYFLGMSLLAQKTNVKRDAAYYAFEQGARLEAANRPSISEVNASLERIQGPLRTFLDTFRQKTVATAN